MPTSNAEKEFVSYIVELMQSIGLVHAKGMFGGHGIFLEGLMFGLVADRVLYLKVDKETESEFRVRGLEAFVYSKKGKELTLSYFQAPDEALEDGEEMNAWANKAYCVAIRAALKKRKK
ncbi:MAG: transcriptional regulator [Gammaproteobacteria bacterium]|nr:MAG: transcriptional regulator [Gammaproteobacteria bacterium]